MKGVRKALKGYRKMKRKGVYNSMEGVGKALKRMGFGKSGEGYSEGVE